MSQGSAAERARAAASPERAWRALSAAITLAAVLLYFIVAAGARDNLQNDSAYYFGVARFMAETGHFAEPIVWHYLSPPPAIVHPPFDYWGGLLSLVLAPVLAVFGATERVAFLFMAAVSAASVVAFHHLVERAAPLKSPVVRVVALVVFAFSPGVFNHRLDTETIALYHLLLIGSLLAFARARYPLAVLLSALVFLTRPDGVFVFVAVTLAAALALRRRHPESVRRAWGWLLGVAGGAVSLYVGYRLVAFGSPGGATARALFVFDPRELYAYGASPEVSWEKVRVLTSAHYLRIRAQMVLQGLRFAELVPWPEPWLAASLLGLGALRRGRAPVVLLVWVMVPACLYLVLWSEPGVFVPWRSLHPLLPLVVLGGGYGADAVVERLRPALARLGRAGAWAGGAGLALAAALVIARVPIRSERPRAVNHAELDALRALDVTFAGQAVASDRPWYVIALTGSPAISIPGNGEAAMIAALERYRVEWLVFRGEHASTAGSRGTLDAIARGERRALGPFRLERVRAGAGLEVFRLRR
ncbi:MAG: hypothetical protein OZ921_07395 [Sorangiineae bacterium]|nr:hypothetical protein [Polyangiaceae bacterium]MEB2322321.1 hypothetical protein [Sorangiineae bacterium]